LEKKISAKFSVSSIMTWRLKSVDRNITEVEELIEMTWRLKSVDRNITEVEELIEYHE
jgi:hypothetical protein